MTQIITLCGLALRATISFQSTVCTSMIAALVLEKRFVRRHCVAHLSVLRGSNDGPRKLVEIMLRSGASILRHAEFWLALCMILTTLALQFTSTILLSDLNDFVIVGNLNQTQVPSLRVTREGELAYIMGNGGYLSIDPLFRIFAEAAPTEESNVLSDPMGLSSTGLIQRGFLPQAESESRIALRRFEGNIMTMNSKVACVRPVMNVHYSTGSSNSLLSRISIY